MSDEKVILETTPETAMLIIEAYLEEFAPGLIFVKRETTLYLQGDPLLHSALIKAREEPRSGVVYYDHRDLDRIQLLPRKDGRTELAFLPYTSSQDRHSHSDREREKIERFQSLQPSLLNRLRELGYIGLSQAEKTSDPEPMYRAGKPGRPPSELYNKAHSMIQQMMSEGESRREAHRKAYDWYCEKANIKYRDKELRDAFKAGMRRRDKKVTK